ncbi:hypothetical protein, partial [Mesomycoplasma ovipneumoniae]|uniref:hypothetical protein n=1 Tax=Mesomycoplasma ovipneumoniae TaxID=29562 RepID=UPI00311A51FA
HIRRNEVYKNIRMDRMVYRADMLAEYQSKPLFLSFVPLFTGEWKVYDFSYKRRISYVDGEELLKTSKDPPWATIKGFKKLRKGGEQKGVSCWIMASDMVCEK